MKISNMIAPFLLAFVAACGNAFVTLGQKKASPFENPFLFGALSLLFAAISMFIISLFYDTKGVQSYITGNIIWISAAGFGLVLLNICLYFLYRNHGASYYTLYSILAIITTSIVLSVLIFNEKMNAYYWGSLLFAVLTIILFMKGRHLS